MVSSRRPPPPCNAPAGGPARRRTRHARAGSAAPPRAAEHGGARADVLAVSQDLMASCFAWAANRPGAAKSRGAGRHRPRARQPGRWRRRERRPLRARRSAASSAAASAFRPLRAARRPARALRCLCFSYAESGEPTRFMRCRLRERRVASADGGRTLAQPTISLFYSTRAEQGRAVASCQFRPDPRASQPRLSERMGLVVRILVGLKPRSRNDCCGGC